MKRYKTNVFFLAGILFVTFLGIAKLIYGTKAHTQPEVPTPAPVSHGPSPSAEIVPKPAQAQAVETVQETVLPSQRLEPAPADPPAAVRPEPAAIQSPMEISSFIDFLSLPENADFRSHEIDWRMYRAYRRSFARSL